MHFDFATIRSLKKPSCWKIHGSLVEISLSGAKKHTWQLMVEMSLSSSRHFFRKKKKKTWQFWSLVFTLGFSRHFSPPPQAPSPEPLLPVPSAGAMGRGRRGMGAAALRGGPVVASPRGVARGGRRLGGNNGFQRAWLPNLRFGILGGDEVAWR